MKENIKKTLILAVGIPVFLGLISFNLISSNFVEYLWYESQAQTQVWTKTLQLKVALYLIGAFVALIGYLASYFAGRRRLSHLMSSGRNASLLNFIYPALAIFLAFFIQGPALASLWDEYILVAFSPEFGLKDPLHGKDISFYLFQLDWYSGLITWFRAYLVLLILYSLGLYILALQFLTDFGFDGAPAFIRSLAGRGLGHLAIPVGLFMLSFAFDSYVGRYALLYDGGSDKFAGASYTDVHARNGAYVILFYTSLLLGIAITAAAFIRSWKIPATLALIWLGAFVILLKAYPTGVQSLRVNPNEYNAEKPFIKHSIRYTRIAWGLDHVKQLPFDARRGVSARALNRNASVIKNIRLWDYRPLLDTYRQLQEIKPYYEFVDVDVDRYKVNGEIRQVMISARELNADDLNPRTRSWIRDHLQYTHGYGAVMSPSNRVTREGQPELWIKNFPPQSNPGVPQIKKAGIYYGELTHNYAVVNTAMKEIDYPRAQDAALTKYSGKGGIQLGGGLRKLLIAWQFDTWKLMFSREIKTDSRILLNRTIKKAVRMLAPYLILDHDPYIVIGKDGRLYWMLDAYTVADKFPYSQRFDREIYSRIVGAGKRSASGSSYARFGGVNYVRNSVKIVVDAYDGKVRMYRIDDKDPVIRAWSAYYPGLFQPISEMPAGLLEHIRYPEMLFLTQAGIFADYHMTNPQAFFNREDRWQIAEELYSGRKQKVEPYYAIVKLPGSKKTEYVLMLPYVPGGKQNLIAWMAARCDYGKLRKDGPGYGELLALEFPRTKQYYGPMQIESRIDQDADISKDLTLWNSQGSRVIRGNMLVIPVDDSVLYVEPVYLQSTKSPFPELKRVVVADANGVVMRESLDGALSALASGFVRIRETSGRSGTPSAARSLAAMARSARGALRRARQSAASGKWEAYGRHMQELANILNRMARLR